MVARNAPVGVGVLLVLESEGLMFRFWLGTCEVGYALKPADL